MWFKTTAVVFCMFYSPWLRFVSVPITTMITLLALFAFSHSAAAIEARILVTAKTVVKPLRLALPCVSLGWDGKLH